jgi:hypothetical protein
MRLLISALAAVFGGLWFIGQSLTGSVPEGMPWNVHMVGPVFVVVGLLFAWIWYRAAHDAPGRVASGARPIGQALRRSPRGGPTTDRTACKGQPDPPRIRGLGVETGIKKAPARGALSRER